MPPRGWARLPPEVWLVQSWRREKGDSEEVDRRGDGIGPIRVSGSAAPPSASLPRHNSKQSPSLQGAVLSHPSSMPYEYMLLIATSSRLLPAQHQRHYEYHDIFKKVLISMNIVYYIPSCYVSLGRVSFLLFPCLLPFLLFVYSVVNPPALISSSLVCWVSILRTPPLSAARNAMCQPFPIGIAGRCIPVRVALLCTLIPTEEYRVGLGQRKGQRRQ